MCQLFSMSETHVVFWKINSHSWLLDEKYMSENGMLMIKNELEYRMNTTNYRVDMQVIDCSHAAEMRSTSVNCPMMDRGCGIPPASPASAPFMEKHALVWLG